MMSLAEGWWHNMKLTEAKPVDDQEAEDAIGDAICDSMDMDWRSSDGAKAIMAKFREEGWFIIKGHQI